MVVAVVASNFVLVAIFSQLMGKTSLNEIQVIGIFVSLFGVVTVTAGDTIIRKWQKQEGGE